MSLDPSEELDPEEENDAESRAIVDSERERLRQFIEGLSTEEIKSGSWFTKLLAQALDSYTTKVDWRYFQERYHGVPADAIVDQRIKMAARYAAISGGLSAAAYTSAIAATIGSLGGASPLTVPAAVVTVMVDLAFVTQLQLRLAYDVAVLYRIPLDLSDPDDMWKFIRVAFTIKGGEAVQQGANVVVPALMRPLIRRFYAGPVLAAARGLPVVGKYLLQRTVIKIGIPLVGVPLAVVLNRYTTLITGRHAQTIFRNEARVIELAEKLSESSRYPNLTLWTAWLVVMADRKISDDEALLMRHLAKRIHDRHQVADEGLARVVDLDPSDAWRRIEAEPGDLSDLVDVAQKVATVDGKANALEQAIISELRTRCARS